MVCLPVPYAVVYTQVPSKNRSGHAKSTNKEFTKDDAHASFLDGGALLTDGELNTLAFEQFYSKVNGVWNLCSAETKSTALCRPQAAMIP
eukprot:1145914-Pelagomonas_calceolata.AAC.3